MSEDMTYTTEPTRAQLAARVAELERENAALMAAAVQNAQDMLALRVECDGLRARLDAVPVDAIRFSFWGDNTLPGYIDACGTVGNWLMSISELAAPDDIDAPLTLAAIDDEDGDL